MKPDRLLLDTHVWFRYQTSPDLLHPRTAASIDEAALHDVVFVSVISVWELAMLERAKRLELPDGAERWVQEALDVPGVSLLPISARVAVASVNLPLPMHKDPADRILTPPHASKE